MVKTLSEDSRGQVVLAVERRARRSNTMACFGIAVTTAVRWLRLWRKAGAHPVIRTRSTRGSTSRCSRRPADVRRFVPIPIGRLFKRRGMSCKRTAHTSERLRFRAAGGHRGERRFEQNHPATRRRRTRRTVPSARTHGHWPITTCAGNLRLPGMIVRMLLDGQMSGGAVLAYIEQVLAAEAAAR